MYQLKNNQNKKNNTPDLSVVILCYKAGDSAREFVKGTLKALKDAQIFDYEIILVGNYHKNLGDKTPWVVKNIARKNPRIKYIAKVKKGMMGWDMKSGLHLATGKYVAVMDGDGQVPTEDIIKVYRKIIEGKYDIVKTYRMERGDSLWRKIISFSFNILFKIFFPGLNARDINSKPKIMSAAVYKKLQLLSDGWFIDAEIMIQARRYHFKIGEVPTVFLGLTGRRSFVTLTTIVEFIINLCKYRIKEFKYLYEYTHNRRRREYRKKISS